uniref:Myb/SANT-like domain-containing protein n=1 Tax=Ananas comosus var. bracteatus TaxID=296719 RepID=A0A6V7PAW0_ANACO|nr:unnamed protein product [Ananas comosus var. bracteatus]
MSRPNGLKVPQGYFYLCDAGYPNGEGFLTPYRGQRYHLSEWRQARQPQTPQELYNYKHSSARNVIERMEEISLQGTSKSRNKGLKHQWTKQEDEKLIECLLELTTSGNWKADNGTFRSGYLQQLEKWMHERLPGCQLKGVPHIESRFKLWKRQYNAISEMLGPAVSGFGWNDAEKCIICEKTAFDASVKSHPTAAGLRGKSFPYLEQLLVVFGKDRATGAGAESAADAARNIEEEELMTHASTQDPDVEMFFMEQNSTQVNTSNCGTSAKSKKRKSSLGEDSINEQFCSTLRSLETSFNDANQHLGWLANCFQFMANNETKKEKLFEEILKIEGLEDKQIMDATEILTAILYPIYMTIWGLTISPPLSPDVLVRLRLTSTRRCETRLASPSSRPWLSQDSSHTSGW